MKWTERLLIILIVLLFGCFYLAIADFSPKKENNEELLNKIEKLESKIDSLNHKKDSIRTIIDSTHVKIIENEKHYQERINTIIVQPDSFSESFTRQYLREYAAANGYYISGTSETEY